MSGRKHISSCSQPTQSQRPRRFHRRNSIHTLICRSGSLKKYPTCPEDSHSHAPTTPDEPHHHAPHSHRQCQYVQNPEIQLYPSSPQLNLHICEPHQISLKRTSGSMRCDLPHRERHTHNQQAQALKRDLDLRIKENQLLEGQCRRLKTYLNEQGDRRKSLEDEIKLNKQEIKRLQKRFEKYRLEIHILQGDKQKYIKQREIIMNHIAELQQNSFHKDTKQMQSIREKIMMSQIEELRLDLHKDRSVRETQLQKQLQQIKESYYAVQGQLRSANIAKEMHAKQVQEAEQEIEEIRQSVYQTVTASTEYMELRERYRRLLVEFRQMAQEMEAAEGRARDRMIENTLLTVSESDLSSVLQ